MLLLYSRFLYTPLLCGITFVPSVSATHPPKLPRQTHPKYRAIVHLFFQYDSSYYSFIIKNAARFPRFPPVALWENKYAGLQLVQISVISIFSAKIPALRSTI